MLIKHIVEISRVFQGVYRFSIIELGEKMGIGPHLLPKMIYKL